MEFSVEEPMSVPVTTSTTNEVSGGWMMPHHEFHTTKPMALPVNPTLRALLYF